MSKHGPNDGQQMAIAAPQRDDYADRIAIGELLALLRRHLMMLMVLPLCAGVLALGITYLIAPTFTARTSLLPPQQQQSSAASALASLGALGGLAGIAAGVKSPAEQYVALMRSVSVSDRMIEKFDLMQVYDKKLRVDARLELEENSRISVGKKDGMMVIEVDDTKPQRAAEMANQFVSELRLITSSLAVSEAQQRRAFFEEQMKNARDQLIVAQQALQSSGFTQGALRAEPKAAAEGYARMRAEVTAAEVQLQTLRGSLAEGAVEVQQQLTRLSAMRAQLAKLEQTGQAGAGPDYIGKYREFKYQETLFDLFARQYELARVDESREGALIQVVDVAHPPERKSRPKRALVAIVTTGFTLIFVLAFVLVRNGLRRSAAGTIA